MLPGALLSRENSKSPLTCRISSDSSPRYLVQADETESQHPIPSFNDEPEFEAAIVIDHGRFLLPLVPRELRRIAASSSLVATPVPGPHVPP